MSSDSVVISSVSFPDITTLPLVVDVPYHEPYVSAGLNRKLRGILSEGFYSGFQPRLAGGLALLITSVEGKNNTGSASVNIGNDYQLTIRQQKDITLPLSAGTKFAIVLKGVYTLGSDTYQVNSKSNIQAAEIHAKTYTDSYELGDGELLICAVNVPAGVTELTEDMIDVTERKDVSIGIELSNDYESDEEHKAATPKAVKDGIQNHEKKEDPHSQYLRRDDPEIGILSSITDIGEQLISASNADDIWSVIGSESEFEGDESSWCIRFTNGFMIQGGKLPDYGSSPLELTFRVPFTTAVLWHNALGYQKHTTDNGGIAYYLMYVMDGVSLTGAEIGFLGYIDPESTQVKPSPSSLMGGKYMFMGY